MRKLTKTAVIVASMAVMAMGSTVMAGAKTEGWVQSGSNWYYYINGEKASDQWVKSGDDWYFIDEEGKMVKNTFVRIDKYDGSSEVLDDNDIHSSLGQDDIDDDSEFYYMNADGKMVTGWKDFKASNIYASPNSSKASTVWYYFGATGRMYVNEWVESSGKWYALSANGQMYAEAVVNNDLVDWDDDDNYYVDKSGAWVKGWYKTTTSIAGSAPETATDGEDDADTTDQVFFNTKDKWVYADPETGVLVQKEWEEINGKYYFFGVEAAIDSNKDASLLLETLKNGSNKNLTSGNITVGNGFTVSGSATTVTATAITANNAAEETVMYSDVFVRWTNHDSKVEYFYLNKDGDALTTWKELDDDYWICGNSKGELYYDEVAKINGKYYYFDEYGICDEKYLNNTVDYVAVIAPESGKKDADKSWHLTTGAEEVVMYETTGSKNPCEDAEELKIADMKKALKEEYYYIDGRKVTVKSMTDNEVILTYTAEKNDKFGVTIDAYKLRTSAKLSGKVTLTK